MKMILASRSPRRRELLAEAGYTFDVVPADDAVECGICSRESAPVLVARLAMQKAENVAVRFDQGLIIGCDTVAECQGQILGKPHNREHAAQMLRMLRGQYHHVFSGLCLWRRPDNRFTIEVAVTRMFMQPLTDAQLEEYLDSDLWEGKAGAFGWQDRQGWLEIVDGSPSNVVGLPLELFERMLAPFREPDGS